MAAIAAALTPSRPAIPQAPPPATKKQSRSNGKLALIAAITIIILAGGGTAAPHLAPHKHAPAKATTTAKLPSVTINGAWPCSSVSAALTAPGAPPPTQRAQDCALAKHRAKQVLTKQYGSQQPTPPQSQWAGYGKDDKPSEQFACLDILWTNESEWDDWAKNPGSPAFGIAQADGHGNVYNYGDWLAQVMWGLNYISGQYTTPCKAWTWWQRTDPRPFPNHWY